MNWHNYHKAKLTFASECDPSVKLVIEEDAVHGTLPENFIKTLYKKIGSRVLHVEISKSKDSFAVINIINPFDYQSDGHFNELLQIIEAVHNSKRDSTDSVAVYGYDRKKWILQDIQLIVEDKSTNVTEFDGDDDAKIVNSEIVNRAPQVSNVPVREAF